MATNVIDGESNYFMRLTTELWGEPLMSRRGVGMGFVGCGRLAPKTGWEMLG